MENFEKITQTPPQNLDAERSVLGGLLLDPIKYASVAPILNESDFYKVSHQLIYAAIERIYDLSLIHI